MKFGLRLHLKAKGEVKVKKTKPSLDAIKARGKKKEVTPEQILAAVEDAPF